ncbi:helix-turn-helix domain-containing protein [Haloarcula marina]|uniref:helix-turn-helix domain-containing protein n=1 Tax=Haloarcula marina TaxID=2961574 RepID=UPI0020B77042|nr:helix-turn-helix domain-containing protein [Halomicroarcula marina]
MTVIAELSINSDEFILGRVLSRDPDTHIEMERVVPSSRRVMPYIWVTGDDLNEFEKAVRESDYVSKLVALDVVNDSGLYRVEWDTEVESLIYGISETNATILEAKGNEHWTFRLRFDDHRGLADFHNYCTEHEITFQLERVYTLADIAGEGFSFDLTDAQRRALVRAVETGYFEVPRGTTLGEISKELGVSQQTVSENVRRGANKVLRATVLDQSAADLVSD